MGSTARRPATLAAAVALVLGAVWWGWPATYPFGPDDRVTMAVSHLIDARTAALLVLTAGVLGGLVAYASGRPSRPWITFSGLVAETAFFGLVLTDVVLVSALGYALALAAPLGLVAVAVVGCLRRQRLGYALAAVLAAVLLVAFAAGVQPSDALAAAQRVLRSFTDHGARVVWTCGMAALAALWAVALVRYAGRDPGGTAAATGVPDVRRRIDAAVLRHGRAGTVVAALCPLPYATVRMSWLTPWPLDGLPPDVDIAVRMQGVAMGTGALLGAVLTVGLISRWGTVFPRWIPALHGRPVPPALAVVPGGLIAAALTMAAPSMLADLAGRGDAGELLFGLLLFPFPVWGPALGLAVYAYHLRRGEQAPATRGDPRFPGDPPPSGTHPAPGGGSAAGSTRRGSRRSAATTR